MKLINLFVQSIVPYFATDFDKTIAHYPKVNDTIATLDAQCVKVVHLPASSTGMKGVIAQETIDLIDQISKHTTVICASGMRESTMRGRQPFVPGVKYWLCENGGQIYETQCCGKLKMLPEWTEYVEKESLKADNAKESLKSFKRHIKEVFPDVKIDNTGYETMMRLKGKPESLQKVINNLPKNLKYTYNLGHLDVQLPCCGKYEAIHWLSYYLEDQKRRTTNTPLHCRLLKGWFTCPHTCQQEAQSLPQNYSTQLSDLPYVYMGDDDNDIPASAHAQLALIANKHSTAVKHWIQAQQPVEKPSLWDKVKALLIGSRQTNHTTTINTTLEDDVAVDIISPVTGNRLLVSKFPYHSGTIRLLRKALQVIQSSASSSSSASHNIDK